MSAVTIELILGGVPIDIALEQLRGVLPIDSNDWATLGRGTESSKSRIIARLRLPVRLTFDPRGDLVVTSGKNTDRYVRGGSAHPSRQ